MTEFVSVPLVSKIWENWEVVEKPSCCVSRRVLLHCRVLACEFNVEIQAYDDFWERGSRTGCGAKTKEKQLFSMLTVYLMQAKEKPNKNQFAMLFIGTRDSCCSFKIPPDVPFGQELLKMQIALSEWLFHRDWKMTHLKDRKRHWQKLDTETAWFGKGLKF